MLGESERLATPTLPWLQDASSPDRTPASSLWQQQRQKAKKNQKHRVSSHVFEFHEASKEVESCTWVSRAQRAEVGCEGHGGLRS